MKPKELRVAVIALASVVGLNSFAVGGSLPGLRLGHLLGCRDRAPGV
jgi:hypothetical protein